MDLIWNNKRILAPRSSLHLIVNPTSQTDTVTDADGNVYNTVTIGNQVWMKENLKTTLYSDGTAISNDRTNLDGAYAWYNNDISNKPIYGGMYSWYAVINTHGLAPTGWRIPSDSDWSSLIAFIGGESTGGGKLKEIGLTHWLTPNAGASDQYGLSLLPGGFRHYNGNFYSMGTNGTFMSTTPYQFNTSQSIAYSVYHNDVYISQVLPELARMASVRCLRDL